MFAGKHKRNPALRLETGAFVSRNQGHETGKILSFIWPSDEHRAHQDLPQRDIQTLDAASKRLECLVGRHAESLKRIALFVVHVEDPDVRQRFQHELGVVDLELARAANLLTAIKLPLEKR